VDSASPKRGKKVKLYVLRKMGIENVVREDIIDLRMEWKFTTPFFEGFTKMAFCVQ